MRRTFQGRGLAVPPVPDPLRPSLRKLGSWFFGTREVDRMEMYLFRDPPTMALGTGDFFAVSHAGHGVNSYSINYQLRYGAVAVWAQAGWGGIYMNPQKTVARVGEMFGRCARLIAAVDAAGSRLEGSPRCLLVVESDLRGISHCRWLDGPPPERHDNGSAFTTAARLIGEA